ncbi:MAG: ribonuclease H-like domain-containing protein [Firmicutes bacterium]|nr:ribonuclease H-like domain-containing protein [Bacillota bacterium]
MEEAYPRTYRHGRIPLDAYLAVPPHGWARLLSNPSWSGFPAPDAVFLDLETTGLGRGTGTYAFLIGIGRFTPDGFVVRQYLMRDYREEPAVLAAVREELARARALVTFNGRSFDWPLLENRAILNRMELPSLPHLDLLYPARKVWRPLNAGCRLAQLEKTVLRAGREADVPGWLIPQLYFRAVRTGDLGHLAGVAEHNRLDILAMAALAGYLGHAAADPLAARPGGEPLLGPELYALGRLFVRQGPLDVGIACLEEAIARGLPPDLRRDGYRTLARTLRREAQDRRAEAVLLSWAREDPLSPGPCIELAKHYEHRARDLEAARTWTLRALDLIRRRRLLQGFGVAGCGGPSPERSEGELAAVVHRLRRIEEKLAATTARRSSDLLEAIR